jgi:hypothetical protein
MSGFREASADLKSRVDFKQSAKQRSDSIKTLWPTSTAASPNDRRIGFYSIGLTIP